jgi:lipoprotein NlpI
MFRYLFAGLIWLAAFSGAGAAGYDDYSQGLAARNRGDVKLAIAKFTAALNAGDLNPELVPVARINRGRARLYGGACADAADDFTAVLKLKPNDMEALKWRASAYVCQQKFDQAIADQNQVVAAQPGAPAFRRRGQIYWLKGDFAAAANDFQQATKLDPKYVYAWLWLDVMRVRGGGADLPQMQRDLHGLDLDEWPLPVFSLFMGELKPEQVMASTSHGDPDALKDRECEANFYTAEWWLAQRMPKSAQPLLEQAVSTCPQSFVERGLAVGELKHFQ